MKQNCKIIAVNNTTLPRFWKIVVNAILISHRPGRMKNVSNEKYQCVNAAELYVTELIDKKYCVCYIYISISMDWIINHKISTISCLQNRVTSKKGISALNISYKNKNVYGNVSKKFS
jgi:hypothetical protein